LEWEGPPGGFDLIVTNFFLDCFNKEDLAKVISKLGKSAAPEANWLLADFDIAPAGPARWRSRVILAMLYRFFRLITGLTADALVPPNGNLEEAGFALHRRKTSDWGLLISEWRRRE
jgi:hypothetical protein